MLIVFIRFDERFFFVDGASLIRHSKEELTRSGGRIGERADGGAGPSGRNTIDELIVEIHQVIRPEYVVNPTCNRGESQCDLIVFWTGLVAGLHGGVVHRSFVDSEFVEITVEIIVSGPVGASQPVVDVVDIPRDRNRLQ